MEIPQTNRRPGAPKIYSDTAIQCTLIVKSVYALNLGAAQGFVPSVLGLMRLDLPVSNYSTVYRRQGALTAPTFASSNSRPRHIVIDATGFRVCGAGDWHVQKHRGRRRWIWRKLHLGDDEQTKKIVTVEMTASHVHDSPMLPFHQQGRYAWRVVSGYIRQSLAENAVVQFKSLLGTRFRARRWENQRVER